MIYYGIRDQKGNYLLDIKPNKEYCPSGRVPTMGNRHCFNEFETIWGKEKTYFEPLTATTNIKVLMEEFRWGARKQFDFKVEIKKEQKNG